MTPRQLQLCIQTHNDRHAAEMENRRVELYAAARLTASFVGRVFNGKQIPTYEKTFNLKPIKKKMTAEEMYAAVKAFPGQTKRGE